MPTRFSSSSSNDAVLLVHGLGGTAAEMRTLERRLNKAGFQTHLPLLAGHGVSPNALRATNWQDWYASVRAELLPMLDQYERVSVAGLCMGALLTLKLAEEFGKRLQSISLISPTMFFDGWAQPWYRFILPFVVYSPLRYLLNLPERPPFGIKNERLRSRLEQQIHQGQAHYTETPIVAVYEVMKLVDTLSPKILGEIFTPTILFHALEDEVASPKTPLFIKQHLGAKDTQIVWLEDSYHMATLDNQRDRIAKRLIKYLHLAGHQPALPGMAPVQIHRLAMNQTIERASATA